MQGGSKGERERGQRSGYLGPKLFIESTGDEASLKENDNPFWSPVFNLKVQVFLPVAQLGFLQGFDMEVGSFNLER